MMVCGDHSRTRLVGCPVDVLIATSMRTCQSAHALTHAHSLSLSLSHTHTHTRARTCTHARTHAHTTCARAHLYIRQQGTRRTYACTHTLPHTTHTHTHTHTRHLCTGAPVHEAAEVGVQPLVMRGQFFKLKSYTHTLSLSHTHRHATCTHARTCTAGSRSQCAAPHRAP